MAFDWNRSFTNEDLERLKSVFRAMSTYGTQDGEEFISTDEIPNFAQVIGYSRPDGITEFEKFWREKYNGRLLLGGFIELVSKQHDSSSLGKSCAQMFDTDRNGFISSDEFVQMTKMLKGHHPLLQDVSYDDFVKEADTNNDGKVSLEECAAWIDRNVPSGTTIA